MSWLDSIAISDLKIFIGNTGIYDTLTDASKYTDLQINAAILSAVEQYKFLMPCVSSKLFLDNYKNLGLSHISIILVYNVYKNANAENNETKSRIERDYIGLLNEFRVGGLYYGFCEKIKESELVAPLFNITLHGIYNPLGVTDRRI